MFVMGIDIGYSNLKIAGSEVGTKAVETRVLPSGAGPVSDLPMRPGKHQDDRMRHLVPTLRVASSGARMPRGPGRLIRSG